MTSQEIVASLPYLRRYARALTGSQNRGDQYVRVCLEAMLRDPERMSSDGDARVKLFTTFHEIWSVIDAITPQGDGSDTDGSDSEIEHSVAALPPMERQVLLLIALERFTIEETARILDIGEREVRALLDRAKAEIRRQSAVRVLIVEDDPVIAMDVTLLVEDMGHQVIGSASRHDEAVRIANEHQPDLILADVELAEGDDGISTVQDILKGVAAKVIFITGHPERLLTGQTLEPAFIITKPFEPDTLHAAIGQALSVTQPHRVEPAVGAA